MKVSFSLPFDGMWRQFHVPLLHNNIPYQRAVLLALYEFTTFEVVQQIRLAYCFYVALLFDISQQYHVMSRGPFSNR